MEALKSTIIFEAGGKRYVATEAVAVRKYFCNQVYSTGLTTSALAPQRNRHSFVVSAHNRNSKS
jgi:hypothetical protein